MMAEPQPLEDGVESILVEETRAGRYQMSVHAAGAAFLVDEPVALGGLGTGPNPYDLLSAALGSCTAMTVRLYADRKGWPLDRVRVNVKHVRSSLTARDQFRREINLDGALDAEQRARLLEIANRCPVHLTLERGAEVETTLIDVAPAAADVTEVGQHIRDMAECVDLGGS
jgi:putative redox protein